LNAFAATWPHRQRRFRHQYGTRTAAATEITEASQVVPVTLRKPRSRLALEQEMHNGRDRLLEIHSVGTGDARQMNDPD